MEIRVYTPELNLLGIIDNFSSLLWNRKYSSAGSFELHVPITMDTTRYLTRGNIVAYQGATEAGIIESIVAEQGSEKNQYTISGRFLESYLDRRLIYNTFESPTFNYSGTVEEGMRTILRNNAILRHPIPLLQIPNNSHGFTEEISFQATYQNLLKYEGKLADSAGYGFKCIPNFVEKTITFDVYKGLDHSESQSDRVRVIFSDEYRNIDNAKYTENDQLYKTTCFVGGQGEGSDRTWVKVGDHTLTGLARREVKLDATDINPEGLSTSDYKSKLTERGENLLNNEDILVCSFECATMPQSNFIYRMHYDLGDVITVKKSNWGISVDLRIKEMSEVYEHGNVTINPVFGNPLPDTIDWEE